MFLLFALSHNMFLPTWPSTGVQCVFKESALLSIWYIRFSYVMQCLYVRSCVWFICNLNQGVLVFLYGGYYMLFQLLYYCICDVTHVLTAIYASLCLGLSILGAKCWQKQCMFRSLWRILWMLLTGIPTSGDIFWILFPQLLHTTLHMHSML
jgi:hypothetical protein